MKGKRDGQLVNTDTHVNLFNRNYRPKVIKLSGCHEEIVEEYRKKLQQCNNCQRFNHIVGEKCPPACSVNNKATRKHNVAMSCSTSTVKGDTKLMMSNVECT